MTMWNRTAAMLGMPDLDPAAFQHVGDKRIKLHMGGGGGGTTTSTAYTSNVPEYAKQPFMDMLGQAQALSNAPYQTFTGDRIAGQTGLQQQAAQTAGSMTPTAQTGIASGLALTAANQALGAGGYSPGQMSSFQMAAPQQVGTGAFTDQGAAQQYMSPYIQQALQPQLNELVRQSDIQGTKDQAAATQAGAYGGARQAIVQAERERNLGQLQGDVLAKGYQTAFEQAANQYATDAARQLQAQQYNQQAGLNVAGANQSASLAAQQAQQQANQFGANLGLQGAQTALQGAGALGTLGTQQFGQQMDIANMQNVLGTQQQQLSQAALDQQYQDFLNQLNYPYQQIGFFSDLLRGTGSSTRQVYPSPSVVSQLAGAGTAAAGLSGLMKKEGGEVQAPTRQAGLADLAVSRMK